MASIIGDIKFSVILMIDITLDYETLHGIATREIIESRMN